MDCTISYLACLSITCCLALLVMMALVIKGVKETMNIEKFNQLAVKLVKHNFYDLKKDGNVALKTVWRACSAGNKKAILCDPDSESGSVYEVAYDGSKNEFCVDKYDKVANARCVADPETLTVFTTEYNRTKE